MVYILVDHRNDIKMFKTQMAQQAADEWRLSVTTKFSTFDVIFFMVDRKIVVICCFKITENL